MAFHASRWDGRKRLEHVWFTGDDAPATADNVVKESFSSVQADASLREELAAPGDQAAPQPGVTQLLGSLMRTPLREKPLVSLARLDRVAHCLNSAVLDCFLGDETNVRLSFGLVGIEQRTVRPARKDEIELPGEIVAVAYPGAHALGEEGRHLVSRVTRQEYAPVSPLLDDARAENVIGYTDDLRVVFGQVAADARPNSFVLRCLFGRLVGSSMKEKR